ncbi:hypothetical protein HK098_006735 [Nowakowskiella sp. JEL0407]|nr:hypothetical protein HK098_006735 [Nowakowskiella sp. JEL0407]
MATVTNQIPITNACAIQSQDLLFNSNPKILKKNAACDGCYLKKLKCNGIKPCCDRCEKTQKICTYNRKNDPNFPMRQTQKAKRKDQTDVQQLDAVSLAALISSFLAQQTQATSHELIQNSYSDTEFPILTSLFGNNCTPQSIYSQIHNNFYPSPAQSPIITNVELPFSAEVIDDMVACFFQYCSFWPGNFIHPETFIKNRYKLPRPLLAVICARGSDFSKFTPMLVSMGVDPGEMLFEYARERFVGGQENIEMLMTSIHMAFFCITHRKGAMIREFSEKTLDLITSLKVFVDPDILESEGYGTFTVVEKEVRRRIISALKLLSVGLNRGAFREMPFPFSVKEPLPFDKFEELSDDGSAPCLEVTRVTNHASYHLDMIGSELHFGKEKIANFYRKITSTHPLELDILAIMIDALRIQKELNEWFTRQPSWVKNSLSASNIHVGFLPSTDRTKIPWLAPHLVISHFSQKLLAYRFTLALLVSRFCGENAYREALSRVDSPVLETFLQMAITESWETHNQIMYGLRNCIQRLDPNYEYTFPTIIFSTVDCALFACTMSDFAATPEQRRQARGDFEFMRNFYNCMGKGVWKMANAVVDDLNKFDMIPYSELKLKLLLSLWNGGGKKVMESILEEFEKAAASSKQ